MVKQEDKAVDLKKFRSELRQIKSLIELVEKAPYRLTNWMITVGLAISAFYITTLLQIKAQTNAVPNKLSASYALGFLMASLCFGFYNRIRFELKSTSSTIRKGLIATIRLVIKASEEMELSELEKMREEENKAKEKFKDFFDKYERWDYFWTLYIQISSLVIGIFNTAFHLIRYLFSD
jgi:hypothetical protein